MQRIFPVGVYAPIRYIIIIAVLILPGWQIMYGQDTTKNVKKSDNKASQQIQYAKAYSWNILFKPKTNAAARKKAITRIQDSLISYFINNHHDTIPKFDRPVYCPCDTLLINLNIKFVNGSGGSVSSPLAVETVKAEGDYLDIQYISNNDPIKKMEPDINPGPYPKTRSIKLSSLGKANPNNSVLAVIDTGLDTTLFPLNISRLLWRRNTSATGTIYNFLPHKDPYRLKDDHGGRHGTFVTALALIAYSKGVTKPTYPRIMILKALDHNKTGSIFSVSCALSYARQNNATVVNASLGYYGECDSVLLHYIKQCNSKPSNPILIFAAAGNKLEDRDSAIICKPADPANRLTNSNTFYPASCSPELNHVITITGLNKSGKSCYYQNYSNEVVTLGVKNVENDSLGQILGGCCSYIAPFNKKRYEGSSFATPVACGMLLRYMLKRDFTTRQLINDIAYQGDTPTGNIIYRGTSGVTIDGKYLVFPVKNPF